MKLFKYENNERFYKKSIEKSKYPKHTIKALVENLDLLDYEVVLLDNGAKLDVYDLENNGFLGLNNEEDILDFTIEHTQLWLEVNGENLELEELNNYKRLLEDMQRA